MTVLLNGITADAESSPVSATGPILLSVLGNTQSGVIKVAANIGSGYATAWKKTKEDGVGFVRLSFSTGVTFKVQATGLQPGDNITVEYIYTD